MCNSVTSEHCIKDNYKINVKSLQANNLLRSLCEIARIDETIVKIRPKAVIEVILNGSDRLPVASNKRLFCDVCRFISATGRFMFYTD